MIGQLLRDWTDLEIALVLEYAVQVFGEDLDHTSGIPASLRKTPALGEAFNRAISQADSDLNAIDQAITAVTGRTPPESGRPR